MLVAPLLLVLAAQPAPLRVYHIGNSVTDTIRYPALKQAAADAGYAYEYGRHMIPGAPLSWLWDHQDGGFVEAPYGPPRQAFGHFTWDVVTLQPFDRHLEGEDGDLTVARRYLDLLFAKSPDARVLVYQRWPRRDEDGSLDYRTKWLRPYTGCWDGSNESRDYFARVLEGLRAAYPDQSDQFEIVPVGDVIFTLHEKARAGRLPGLTSATDLYVDGIHFGNLGSYLVGATFFAALFDAPASKVSPKAWGLEPSPTTRAIAALIEETLSP